MQIERRALYNALRMNWLLDPTLAVETWQVTDYRSLTLEELLNMLKDHDILLTKGEFIALSDDVDTPEDLTEELVDELELSLEIQDQIYLIIFEVWRRIVPQKRCLSIFCDELDHQIYLYDLEKIDQIEPLEDAIANLLVILDENVDQGEEPKEIFKVIGANCANDIENFLHDFIAEQIDNDNDSYAVELLEGFDQYIENNRWFDFFKARVLAHANPIKANARIRSILEETDTDPSLELNLEMLSFMVQAGDNESFLRLVNLSIPLLESEEDFQDLLAICSDYYLCLDLEEQEKRVEKLLASRKNKKLDAPFAKKDPQAAELLAILTTKQKKTI